jgi:ankyrin repeat protein
MKDGTTPLLGAVVSGHHTIAKLLVERGASYDIQMIVRMFTHVKVILSKHLISYCEYCRMAVPL